MQKNSPVQQGENCRVGSQAVIGEGVVLGHNCVIEDGATLGDLSLIHI